MTLPQQLEPAAVGQTLERRLVADLGLQPLARFADLQDLRSLDGQPMGYVRAWSGPQIARASSLSIGLGPAGRYFNISLVPEPAVDAPRFVYEGLVSATRSQVSVDLLPDVDPILDFDRFEADYAAVATTYAEAAQDPELRFAASRQAHMRALVSPYFLCCFAAPASALGRLEGFAMRYYEAWLALLRAGRPVAAEELPARQRRRARISQAIMTRDPDRPMVVQVFGEAVTQAIQDATLP